MRGADTFTWSLFTMRRPEGFVPAKHPLRASRWMANAALSKLGPLLTAMYAAELKAGRPSIAPEKLPRAMVTQADGLAEREAAKAMISDAQQALGDDEREGTLGPDEGYDAKEFIDACVEMKVTPHVMQNTSGRKSAVPDEIARTEGYVPSQRKRKLIEQGFGWAKTVGSIRQVVVRGLKRVGQMFVLTVAAYHLVLIRVRTLG